MHVITQCSVWPRLFQQLPCEYLNGCNIDVQETKHKMVYNRFQYQTDFDLRRATRVFKMTDVTERVVAAAIVFTFWMLTRL